jgi:hypothetical protein
MSVIESERSTSLPLDEPTLCWDEAKARFLSAVEPAQREAVSSLLQSLNSGGSGLRDWLAAIAWRGALLPKEIPAAVIDVYLRDSEAVAHHECEDCGLAIPVRVQRWQTVDDGSCDVYFPTCPACGGRTGWYLHRSKEATAQSRRHTEGLRRRKPR